MKNKTFKRKDIVDKKLMALISKGKVPSLRILRIAGSSFSGKLIFIDCVIINKSGDIIKRVLTLTPTTARHLFNKLKKEIEKAETKGNFKRFIERRDK